MQKITGKMGAGAGVRKVPQNTARPMVRSPKAGSKFN